MAFLYFLSGSFLLETYQPPIYLWIYLTYLGCEISYIVVVLVWQPEPTELNCKCREYQIQIFLKSQLFW